MGGYKYRKIKISCYQNIVRREKNKFCIWLFESGK